MVYLILCKRELGRFKDIASRSSFITFAREMRVVLFDVAVIFFGPILQALGTLFLVIWILALYYTFFFDKKQSFTTIYISSHKQFKVNRLIDNNETAEASTKMINNDSFNIPNIILNFCWYTMDGINDLIISITVAELFLKSTSGHDVPWWLKLWQNSCKKLWKSRVLGNNARSYLILYFFSLRHILVSITSL